MSSDPSDPLSLAREFPAATREQWLTLVDKVLAGRSFDRVLVGQTRDGLRIEPLYSRRPDAMPMVRGTPGAWQVVQRIDHPDPAAANAEALHDLENGATGLMLVVAGSASAHGFGLDPDARAIDAALADIYLDAGIALEIDAGEHAGAVTQAVADIVRRRGISAGATDIRFGLDPLGTMARTGIAIEWRGSGAAQFGRHIGALAEAGFRGPFAVADGRPVHAAGGSEAQELAFCISAAVAYLRALEPVLGLEGARSALFFRLTADTDQLLTTAKLRALRSLWARVEQACGLAPAPAYVSAETAWRSMTTRDPYVNMLRATIATFAAGTGGADAIAVLPFTLPLGLPDRFARRIARNTSLVLCEEANLHRVADPAAGSGAIEALTDGLCQTAWALFQRIEAAGGLASVLADGRLDAEVAEARAALEADVAHGRLPIIGTSAFPHLAELPVAVLDVPARTGSTRSANAGPALPAFRLAAPFETLRERGDAAAVAGNRPKVMLAALGTPAETSARVTFASNFFASGGFDLVVGEASDADQLAAAFARSGAVIACLCSSDAVYAERGTEAARALSQAGASRLYLAGRPGEREAQMRDAGVQGFIFAGCNAVSTLQAAHDSVGTAPALASFDRA